MKKCLVGNDPVAQGELLIQKIDALPAGVKPMEKEAGRYIIGHSETGHHHVVRDQRGVECFANDNDSLSLYLMVNMPKEECFLKHERDFDTHRPFFFGDGIYRIRRQIESSPEGFVRALD